MSVPVNDISSIFDLEVTIDNLDCAILEKIIGAEPSFVLSYFNDCINRAKDLQNDYINLINAQFRNILLLYDYDTFFEKLLLELNDDHVFLLDSLLIYLHSDDSDKINNLECINKFNIIKEMDHSSQIKICNIIFKSHFVRNNMFNLPKLNGKEEERSGFFSLLIDRKPTNGWDVNIGAIKPIIDIYINSSSDELLHFVERLYCVLELNVSYSYSDLSFIDINKCASLKFVSSLLRIMMYIYYRIEEIISDKILTNLPRPDYKLIDTDNLYTKIVVTTLYAIKLGHLSLRNIRKTIIKDLDSLKEDVFMFVLNDTEQLQKKLAILKKQYDRVTLLYDDKIIKGAIINLMQTIITNGDSKYSDDFAVDLNDLILDEILNNSDYEISKDVLTYIFKIIQNIIPTNKHIRFSSCITITTLCEIKGYGKINDFGYDIIFQGFHSVIQFISEINYFDMVQPPITYLFHQNILGFINYYCDKIIGAIAIRTITESSFHKIVSYANNFIFDIVKMCKQISEEIEKINHSKKMRLISSIKRKLKPIIMEYFKSCMASVQTLYTFLKSNIINITDFTEELILPLSSFIISTLEFFSNKNGTIYEILHMNMEILDIMKEIFILLNTACDNKYFSNNLIKSTDMILDMVSRVKINNELKSSILNHMERIKNTILDTDYNLPDDFIDPFLYTEIKNPVMLPNIDQVFDRSSIMSHLREKSTNPLTNELFTIDDFLQYNDTEKVKHQVNTFLDKKRKYIEENYKS
jgi:hypothetical protein